MNAFITRLKKPQTRTGYLVVAGSLLISYGLWIGSMWFYDDWYDNRWHYPAKAGSHGALLLMSWAFILSTRFRPVERLFGGLDEVYQAHRYIGEAAFYLVFLHPIFLAMDRMPDVGRYLSFFLFSGDWVRNTGIIALSGFILLVAVSIYIKIRYHIWKQTHHFFGLLFVLVLVHAVMARGEIVKYPILTGWFAWWSAMALTAYVYIRIFYRWIGPEYRYVVARMENRPGDVTELYLKPRRRRMKPRPGQFLYIAVDTNEISGEAHPFSISSAPDDPELRLSIKRLGDWTARVEKIREGAPAKVWGPYGRFSEVIFEQPDRDVVLLGGGIGITPFLSIVKSPSLPGRAGHVWLIYSNEDEESASYIDEIRQVADRLPNFDLVCHFSNKEGYIDREYLSEKVGKLEDKLYFICGPAPMMEAIQEALVEAGVPLASIETEDFNVR